MREQSLILKQIKCRENKEPNKIDKVPIKARGFNASQELIRIFFVKFASGKKEIEVYGDAADQVQNVQSCDREVNTVKVIFVRKNMVLKFHSILVALQYEKRNALDNGGTQIFFEST